MLLLYSCILLHLLSMLLPYSCLLLPSQIERYTTFRDTTFASSLTHAPALFLPFAPSLVRNPRNSATLLPIVKSHRQADSSDLRFCDRRIANKPIRDACAALFPASRTAHAQESKKRAKNGRRAYARRPFSFRMTNGLPSVFVSCGGWIAARYRFVRRMDLRSCLRQQLLTPNGKPPSQPFSP